MKLFECQNCGQLLYACNARVRALRARRRAEPVDPTRNVPVRDIRIRSQS